MLVFFGIAMVFVEFAYPKFAAENPLGRWAPPHGPKASRFARMVGAALCIIFGIKQMDIFAASYLSPLVSVVFLLIPIAMIHDFVLFLKRPKVEVGTVRPVAPLKSNRKKKRRK